MRKTVTMILKGTTRVISFSKEGEKRSLVGFTRFDSIELDGKNVLPMVLAPLTIENGSECARLYGYDSATEIKDCDHDELALQIEVEDEFHPEWMSFAAIDFNSTVMLLTDGAWYMTDGNEDNWEWLENLSAPIMMG